MVRCPRQTYTPQGSLVPEPQIMSLAVVDHVLEPTVSPSPADPRTEAEARYTIRTADSHITCLIRQFIFRKKI